MNKTMTEEDIDAEMEKVQQKTTATLQQIDENFSACNRHSLRLLSEIERYGVITQQIWDNSQKWIRFFELLTKSKTPTLEDETEYSTKRFDTNRPVLKEATSSSHSRKGELTTSFGSRISQSLRKPLMADTPFMSDTLTSTAMKYPTIHHEAIANSNSTMSSPFSTRLRQSPPRNIPFNTTSEQLEGTPIHIQAQILTENRLRSVGVQSSDDDENEFKRPSMNIGGQKQSWNISNMDKDDSESRANFEKFLVKRNQPQHSYIKSNKRPVLPVSPMKRARDDSEEEEVGAYEFSGGLQENYNMNTETVSRSSFSSLSSMDEQSSIIPAQFNLQVFPEQFRTPPGSIKLTRVYHLFNQRPGTMLTVKDIMDHLKDTSYHQATVTLIINLLERKRFIKKVGKREAWVIRR